MGIKAVFPAGVTDLTVHGLHQWDRGQILEIHDSTLPASIEVHFAHRGMDVAPVVICPVADGVAAARIPDVCLKQTTPVVAWVYEANDASGQTIRTIIMPLVARARPENVPEGATAYVDVSDTTATEDEVLQGEIFHKADGSTAVGTLVPGSGGGWALPTFDLVEAGMPTVPLTGETKDLEHSLAADICAALDQGPVKFILPFDTYGEVELIMSKASIGGQVYQCTHAIVLGEETRLISLTVEGDYIAVGVGEIGGGEAEPAGIPFFDLAALGLPTVDTDGTTADLVIDTAEIRAALDNGPVKFAVNVEGYGRVDLVMNKYTIVEYGLYMCVYYGGDIVCTLMIAENALQVSIEPSAKLPSVSSDDDGKFLRVVNGTWTAVTVPSAEMEEY